MIERARDTISREALEDLLKSCEERDPVTSGSSGSTELRGPGTDLRRLSRELLEDEAKAAADHAREVRSRLLRGNLE